MKHVFVETTWVVDCAKPTYLREPAARSLAERAQAGELLLHIPSICFTEARNPIKTKYQPRTTAKVLREYLQWATKAGRASAERIQVVRKVLDQYEAEVSKELDDLDATLEALRQQPGLDVFALNDRMLERAVSLSGKNLNLHPFDQAILAGILARAEELLAAGADDLCFCELDSDLQPWDKDGRYKQPLKDLYDAARIWVFRDFAMSSPEDQLGFSKAPR
jgi:hypothetical protein